jgi:hypothetical protein
MATTPVVYDSASRRHRPLADGEQFGTGFVTLTGDQTVGGSKTFTSPITGSLNGQASRALADASGHVFTEYYVPVPDLVTLAEIDAMFA